MKIANIKHYVYAAGFATSAKQPRPDREQFEAGAALAKKRSVSIHTDGRCYVPFQPFVRRSLRKNPKAAG